MEFQYAVMFDCNGVYYFELHDEMIYIYLLRAKKQVTINHEGEILEICEVVDNTNNTNYWHELSFKSDVKIGDKHYKLYSGLNTEIFASSYSRLLVEENENEIVLYDTKQSVIVDMIVTVGLVIGSIIIIFLIVLERTKNLWHVKK